MSQDNVISGAQDGVSTNQVWDADQWLALFQTFPDFREIQIQTLRYRDERGTGVTADVFITDAYRFVAQLSLQFGEAFDVPCPAPGNGENAT